MKEWFILKWDDDINLKAKPLFYRNVISTDLDIWRINSRNQKTSVASST